MALRSYISLKITWKKNKVVKKKQIYIFSIIADILEYDIHNKSYLTDVLIFFVLNRAIGEREFQFKIIKLKYK